MSQLTSMSLGSAGEIAGVYIAPPPPRPRAVQARGSRAVCPRAAKGSARTRQPQNQTDAELDSRRPAPSPAVLSFWQDIDSSLWDLERWVPRRLIGRPGTGGAAPRRARRRVPGRP